MERTDNIVIVEKPDSVSYESIQKLIHSAHESNKAKGLKYGTADQSVEELKETLSHDAVCLVALDGDKLAATGTLEFRQVHIPFKTFHIAYFGLAAVSPEYKSHHLGSRILDERIRIAETKGYKYLFTSSAEQNEIIKAMFLKRGFKKINYKVTTENNFYSVHYMKWPHKSKIVDIGVDTAYLVKRAYIRARYKPGKIKRFI